MVLPAHTLHTHMHTLKHRVWRWRVKADVLCATVCVVNCVCVCMCLSFSGFSARLLLLKRKWWSQAFQWDAHTHCWEEVTHAWLLGLVRRSKALSVHTHTQKNNSFYTEATLYGPKNEETQHIVQSVGRSLTVWGMHCKEVRVQLSLSASSSLLESSSLSVSLLLTLHWL